MSKKISGKKMPGFLVSIYDKAAKMVIDSYYVPLSEEIITELSQIGNHDLEDTKRLLDIGTGPGYLPIEIAKRTKNIIIDCIDPLSKSIKIANKNAAQAGVIDKVHFEIGDACKLRFTGNTYDMIVSTGVLHELEDPVKALNECYRVLKRGGIVFIHDPARVSAGIDRKKWLASLTIQEKIIFRLFTLFFKFKPPHTYSKEDAEEILAATDFDQYYVEEYWVNDFRELKIKLKK